MLLTTIASDDLELQNKVVYDAYVHDAKKHGTKESYHSLFPNYEGCKDITLYTHRIGVTSVYVYENKSAMDTLNEHIKMTLENQVAADCTTSGEVLLSTETAPRVTKVVEIKVNLEPGQSRVIVHRPLTCDGATSHLSRSCNVVSRISSDSLRQMTKSKGQVCSPLLCCRSPVYNPRSPRNPSTTKLTALPSIRYSMARHTASWWRTSAPATLCRSNSTFSSRTTKLSAPPGRALSPSSLILVSFDCAF